MPLEFNQLKIGCNAKLPASDLFGALSLESIGDLSSDSSVMGEYSQTIDTVYAFGGSISSFVDVALSHCANDLLCSGVSPEYSSYSLGVGVNLTSHEVSELVKEVIQSHQRHGIKIINAHTFSSEHTNITITLTGLTRNRKAINGDLIVLQTKPLLGMSAYIQQLKIGNSSYVPKNLLKSHYEIIRVLTTYAHPCSTDVSGFGFLGHLLIAAFSASLHIEIDQDSVAFDVDGIEYFDTQGPGCSSQKNFAFFEKYINFSESFNGRKIYSLFEGETNGPLIIFISVDDIEEVSSFLQSVDFDYSVVGTAKKTNKPALVVG